MSIKPPSGFTSKKELIRKNQQCSGQMSAAGPFGIGIDY
jgi:hypothetical protein